MDAAIDRNLITDKELSECDREKLHLIGNIQDGAGHVLFFSHPQGEILSADLKILEVPWIRDPSTSEVEISLTDDHTRNPAAKRPKLEVEVQPAKESRLKGQTEKKSACHDARVILGSKMQDCIPKRLLNDIFESIETMRKAKSQRTFRFFSFAGENYAISVSSTTKDFSVVAVEIEGIEDFEATGNFYNTLVSLGRVMEFYADEKILKTACDTVFNLVDHYDRGMVYQFKDDLSGEVVHEIKKEWVDTSYMGMRFPASDIPLPARELFVKNGLRYIQDIESECNPIINSGASEIDLSHCRMRGVSRPHIVYLRNMGVVSSLSISIVVNGELWGLFAFHGYRKPFKPSLHQRIACESIISMVSVKVESLTRKAESARVIELSENLMNWEQSHSVAHNLEHWSKGLLKVLDVDVIVGRLEDPLKDEAETVVLGDASNAPDDATFWKKFENQPSRTMIHTSTRAGIAALGIEEGECPASGFVYFQDGLVRMMLGRSQRSKDVAWAGNPDEAKLRIGGILCPRNSFATFMQKAKKETRAWDATDLHVISTFMDRVCEHSHNRNATLLKNDIEEANVKYFGALERSEDNSQFFAQMSHELRTPFHGVMGCLNLLQDSIQEMSNEDIQDLINTAMSTGNHMINLLNDILNISKDKHQEQLLSMKTVKIKDLATEPLDNLRTLAASKKIAMTLELDPKYAEMEVVTDKEKYMQIISNMVNNSIKFAEGGTIRVQLTGSGSMAEAVHSWGEEASPFAGTVFTMQENVMYNSVENVKAKIAQISEQKGSQNWVLASIADSGCGIKSTELGEMLKAYTQSSRGTNRAFQGTGLGLYICVSLCHQLGGFLSCSSTPGVGSVFHIGIPVGTPGDEEKKTIAPSIPTEIAAPAVATATSSLSPILKDKKTI